MSAARVALVSALSSVDSRDKAQVVYIEPPVGVLTVASVIRGRFPTSFVDLDYLWLTNERCGRRLHVAAVETIVATKPDVVGFSSVSGSYPATIRLAQAVARELPAAKIVIGGPQASVVDVETLRAFPFVHAIVRGEAEETFPKVLDALLAGGPLDLTAGVTFRHGARIIRNANAPVIEDLDRVPLPAFDLYPDIGKRVVLPLEIGRGCPFACKFCSTNDFFRRRFRLKGAVHAIRQMQELHKQYPAVKTFELVHDMYTVDRSRVVEFCEALIAIGSPFQWSCSARTDCVDPELLELMKAAGCDGIFFGIETGSQRLQHAIGKDLDLEQSRRILAETDRLALPTTASLITGYPQEAIEDFKESLGFIADTLRYPTVDHQLHILSPLAETPLTTEYRDRLYLDDNWSIVSENGLEQQPEDSELIAAHPRIFPNFYAFPCELDRRYLRQISDFLIYGSLRFSSMLLAVYRVTGDLFTLADNWRAEVGHVRPAYYLSWDFVYHAVGFVEKEYSEGGDPGILVTTRFHRALADQARRGRPQTDIRGRLYLAHGTYVVTIAGDIVAAIDCLRRGERPPESVLEREATVVVSQKAGYRTEISIMPELALSILRHASDQAAIEDVVDDFRRREIRIASLSSEAIVARSIQHLSRQGLVRYVAGEAA